MMSNVVLEIPNDFSVIPCLPAIIYKYDLCDDKHIEKINIDGAWLVLGRDSKIASLVREKDTPIYNLETIELTTEETLKMQEKLREEKLYFLIDTMHFSQKLQALTRYNFEIVEVVKEDLEFNFLSLENKVYMFRVEYNPNHEEVEKTNLKYYDEYDIIFKNFFEKVRSILWRRRLY